jgi:transporter family-2 protein
LLTRWEVALAVVAGVFVATAQAGLVPRLGVALFTLAFVTGQAVTGLAADATGLGGGPQRHLSLSRFLAVTLAVFGVALTSTSAEGRPATPGGHAVLGLAVVVGAALATQQAANGRLARATNAPAAVALVNFVLGLIATFLVLLALRITGGEPWPHPERWWPYAGGLIGAAVVAVTAAAVPRLGVLTVAIALISGQVVGALAIDVVATSALPTLASTGGAALVLGGVALALR